MFEKVNPAHPDKIADRIAGALIDYAYSKEENPRIAVEVLIGHGDCFIIAETSVSIPDIFVSGVVDRIAGRMNVIYREYPQDKHLSANQENGLRCGDNGIFRGVPVTGEQKTLSEFVRSVYSQIPYDGKYIIDEAKNFVVMCQSNMSTRELKTLALRTIPDIQTVINPLGDWTGGPGVDSGATNRKLGSDMGDAVTGGGLHGKDLSKADVSVNIYCHLKAQDLGRPYETYCAIGDEMIDGYPYADIVEVARQYIQSVGGFEKFAEWGLIR